MFYSPVCPVTVVLSDSVNNDAYFRQIQSADEKILNILEPYYNTNREILHENPGSQRPILPGGIR